MIEALCAIKDRSSFVSSLDIVGFLRHLRIGGLPAADIWYIPLPALLANINAIRLYMHNTCISIAAGLCRFDWWTAGGEPP